ncbi:unnamed protein product [Blepharisma stoltei]|uniref:ATP synthase F0 subunit 8 n=1 Tax=Blepharisma stoltei TaxID=1481888 RepID=A0AAU9JVF4_9CILI|nr:unnamed protein product [Blepharisma stoltei]
MSFMLVPFAVIWPIILALLLFLSLPAKIFKSVVLPAPEEPIKTRSSPGLAFPKTAFNIWVSSPLFSMT